ncbi:hypothetical protein VKT23_000498 [Stygiomarasmius scandens]|uniref:Uncharacterized protein n=1 Tax=Marasmiellus scandens TaxID=2682957 RepID=A0ABR1K850_9AGAR
MNDRTKKHGLVSSNKIHKSRSQHVSYMCERSTEDSKTVAVFSRSISPQPISRFSSFGQHAEIFLTMYPYQSPSPDSAQGFSALKRNEKYFLTGGDLFFLVCTISKTEDKGWTFLDRLNKSISVSTDTFSSENPPTSKHSWLSPQLLALHGKGPQ